VAIFYGVIVITSKPLKPCAHPMCPNLTIGTRCEKHSVDGKIDQASDQRYYDKYLRDKRSFKFYHSKEWRQTRAYVFGLSHGLCDQCRQWGVITPGNVIHHKVPLKRDYELRLDLKNLICLCNSCHNKIDHCKGKDA